MTNNCVSTVFGVLGVLAALIFPAAPGNAAEAQTGLGGKLVVCGVCHGVNGLPKLEGVPIIWGLQENYLVKQLQDFHSGDRDSDVMTWMATFFSQAELVPTAAFFAKKNWPARSAGAAAASPPAGVVVCQACHQQNLVGGLAAPRLAGQTYEYLIESMRRYADGERTNNPIMMAMMKSISPAEREAMARYISGL